MRRRGGLGPQRGRPRNPTSSGERQHGTISAHHPARPEPAAAGGSTPAGPTTANTGDQHVSHEEGASWLSQACACDDVGRILSGFEAVWKKECSKKHPSLLRAVLWFQHRRILLNVLLTTIELVCSMLLPGLVSRLLATLGEWSPASVSSDASGREVVCLTVGIAAVATGMATAGHLAWYVTVRLDAHVTTALQALVFRRTLQLSHAQRTSYSPGQLVGLMAVDTAKHDSTKMVAWATFGLYGGLLLPAAQQVSACRASRATLVAEALQGIKTLKVYGWVDWFRDRVEAARHSELQALFLRRLVQELFSFVGSFMPVLLPVVVFSSYALLHPTEPLPASTTFTAMLWFAVLKRPLTELPVAFSRVMDTIQSFQRVQHLLLLSAPHGATQTYDADKFARVIHACALETDVASLAHGADTIVGTGSILSLCASHPHAPPRPGDCGMSLSGGQRQRLALARAAYSDADIILMDDVFSAVDSVVGAHIFNHCITGLLRGRTRLLVLHDLQYARAPEVDGVVVMSHGTIVAAGPLAEVLAQVPETVLARGRGSADDGPPTHDGSSPKGPRCSPQRGSTAGESHLSAVPAEEPTANSKRLAAKHTGRGLQWADLWAYGSEFGPATLALAAVSFVAAKACTVSTNYVLASWVGGSVGQGQLLGLLVALGAINATVLGVRKLGVAAAGVRASQALHSKALRAVLAAPCSWFDSHQAGLVQSRFIKDVQVLDEALPVVLPKLVQSVLSVVAVSVVISFNSPILLLLMGGGVLPYFFWMRRRVRVAHASLRRLDAAAAAPIVSHLGEALRGAAVIRAFGQESRFETEMVNRLRSALTVTFPMWGCRQLLHVQLKLCGTAMVVATTLSCVWGVYRGTLSATTAGLALTYALQLPESLIAVFRHVTSTEAAFVSVERLDELSAVEAEGSHRPTDGPAWVPPTHSARGPTGELSVRSLCLRYRPEGRAVVDGVSFRIDPGIKLAVVGRSGSGKSSLMSALVGLYPPHAGTVTIDGQDTSSLSLPQLRDAVVSIMQDPFVFTGSLLENIAGPASGPGSVPQQSPTTPSQGWIARLACAMAARLLDTPRPLSGNRRQRSSEGLATRAWGILRTVGLEAAVRERSGKLEIVRAGHEEGLGLAVDHGGSNLSAGERQLLCLARALLQEGRIYALDEATANVDTVADRACTDIVLGLGATAVCILHRLTHIHRYDKVAVMDAGKIVEFGPPRTLLARGDSHLSQLVAASGCQLAELGVSQTRNRQSPEPGPASIF